ncbi:MAG: putative bifunctional diguanylate cyclase/phosphodiesterase, partial [Burkholderiales bacterium]
MNEKLERRATELAKEMTHELQQLNEKLEARVTGHRLAELALRESEELLRQLSSNIPQLFWVCEAGENDQLLFLSPAWHSITGLPRPTDQQGLFDSIHPGDHRRVVMTSAKSPHGGIDHEYRIMRADDSIGWLHTRTFPIRNHAGEVYRIAGITEDISERKVAEQRLLQLAHYDGLTNLPNRTQFHRSLISTLEYAQKSQWIMAVLFIDIDRFKIVNDTLGHAVGDALLQQVATRLVESLRSRDVVGRLGGDEFAVMLPTLNNADDAGTVAGKLLHALAKPLLLEGRDMIITASIGITIFPTDATDASELLRYADTAMYRAKQEGRNTFRYYTAEMNERAEEKLELESCLRQALDRNEFLLHYQPKLDLKSGRLSGAEALLRWQRPGFGLISPADFIPLLEETGLILE